MGTFHASYISEKERKKVIYRSKKLSTMSVAAPL
jgi:hypothetical protein